VRVAWKDERLGPDLIEYGEAVSAFLFHIRWVNMMIFLMLFLYALSNPCTVSHAHHYSDLRLAIIQVGKVEKCEFYYSNLEERTTPVEPLTFDVDFELSMLESNKDKIVVAKIDKERLKPGVLAICIYCSSCRACVSMRLIHKSELKTAK
jgi:hypothetical protein